MRISANLIPGPNVVAQAKLAEELGYERVYITDSPALYSDIWSTLTLLARETGTIGLGTGVLVPFTRHPVVNAAAIATIESISPGRLVVALGAGNSARRTLGERKPSRLAWLGAYVEALRGLLGGETVEWEGKKNRLIGIDGYWPPFPLRVPIYLNVLGPKGHELAKALGVDGVVGSATPDFEVSLALVFGTVLDAGEEIDSDRARQAHAPMTLTGLHNLYEDNPELLDGIPGGARWRATMDALCAPEEKHLVVHRGHCVVVTGQDDELTRNREFLEMGRTAFGAFTADAATVAATMRGHLDRGASEILYLPSGPDVERELRAFADAVR